MFKAIWIKQYIEVQNRIWTYPIVGAVLCVLAQDKNPIILLILGAILSMDLAIQIGGDEVRNNTFEFIFTRAINRKFYFFVRFLFGASFIVLLAIILYLFEAFNLGSLFWSTFAEPIKPIAGFQAENLITFVNIFAGLFLLYSVCILFCSESKQESTNTSLAILGLLVTGVFIFADIVLINWLLDLDFRDPQPGVTCLVCSIPVIQGGMIRYARRELPQIVERKESVSTSSGWLLSILIVLIIVFVVFMAYLLTAVGPIEGQ